MKNLFTAIALFAAQTALAIPSAVWIEIVQMENTVQYSIEEVSTRNFEQLASKLKHIASSGTQYPSGELHFHINLKGNINISEVLRIKEVLTPFGFDHYTIQSLPEFGTIITVTIGTPEDTQLFDRFKAKIIPLDE